MRRLLPVSLLLGLSVLLAHPTPALADNKTLCKAEAQAVRQMSTADPALDPPTNPQALQHMEAAKNAFGVSDYDTAVAEYVAAGKLDSSPRILYNLGQTYRDAKQYEKAIRQYRLFIQRGAPGPELTALIECHIATMQAELDHAAASAPPTGPATDHPNGGEQTGSTGSTSQWTGKRKAAIGVGAAGVVAVLAAGVFGLQSRDFNEQSRDVCPSNPCGNADEANALSDKADSRAMLANVSLGVGGALIVGAAVLWYLGAPSSSAPPSDTASVVPHLSPTYAGLAFSTRF